MQISQLQKLRTAPNKRQPNKVNCLLAGLKGLKGASLKMSIHKNNSTERRCAVTGETKSKDELVRFVVSPDNQVTPDLKANLPGRGVWVSAGQETVKEAVKRKLFHRNFAMNCSVNTELASQVAHLLEKAALGRLKMANKAGLAVYGFAKLMSALDKQTIIAVLHAKEASRPEAEKIDYRFSVNLEKNGILQETLCKKPFYSFKTQELSLAFGSANVIHAGLKQGGAATIAIESMVKHIVYCES